MFPRSILKPLSLCSIMRKNRRANEKKERKNNKAEELSGRVEDKLRGKRFLKAHFTYMDGLRGQSTKAILSSYRL